MEINRRGRQFGLASLPVLGGVGIQMLLGDLVPGYVWAAVVIASFAVIWWLAGNDDKPETDGSAKDGEPAPRSAGRRDPATWRAVLGGLIVVSLILFILNVFVPRFAQPLSLDDTPSDEELAERPAEQTQPRPREPDLELGVAEMVESLKGASTTVAVQERIDRLYIQKTIDLSGVVEDAAREHDGYRIRFGTRDHTLFVRCPEELSELAAVQAGYTVTIRGTVVSANWRQGATTNFISLEDCEFLRFSTPVGADVLRPPAP